MSTLSDCMYVIYMTHLDVCMDQPPSGTPESYAKLSLNLAQSQKLLVVKCETPLSLNLFLQSGVNVYNSNYL